MQLCDFRRSFVFNTSACDGIELNTCRTQILSRCEIVNQQTGEQGKFFLGKACIGEHMYLPAGIAQIPTSEVCIVFSQDKYKLMKKFADHSRDVIQIANPYEKMVSFSGKLFYWTDFHFDLALVDAGQLKTAAEIAEATFASRPLVGRTTIRDEANVWKAIIDYPIPYMNVHPPANAFQVDVGPVLFPDFSSIATSLIARMEMAYILFHTFDRVEFAVRVPTSIGENAGCETLHYSHVVYGDAINELYRLPE